MRTGLFARRPSRSRYMRPVSCLETRRYLPDGRGRLQKKYDLGIGAGSKRTVPASELLFRMVCHSAGSWRTSREVFSHGYCPWCSPYHPKLLNDIDTVCGDMALIEGVDLALDVSDQHGVHLTMSHDNDIDCALDPYQLLPDMRAEPTEG